MLDILGVILDRFDAKEDDPRMSVSMRKMVTSFFLPTWVAQTDMAIDKLLPINTTVLDLPRRESSERLSLAKMSGRRGG